MARMDEIVAELLADSGALGVWLIGATAIAKQPHPSGVLAAAVTDASIASPAQVCVEGETFFAFGDRKIFAEPIGGATLVIVFDDRSSLGLIRIRVRNAKQAIERALAARCS